MHESADVVWCNPHGLAVLLQKRIQAAVTIPVQ
jgi:hypothetical protein